MVTKVPNLTLRYPKQISLNIFTNLLQKCVISYYLRNEQNCIIYQFDKCNIH